MPITTKIRDGDWESVQKAIRQLQNMKYGVNSSPHFNNVFVSNTIEVSNGAQIQGFTIERVADAAARLALDFYLARMVYQDDEGTLWIATTL